MLLGFVVRNELTSSLSLLATLIVPLTLVTVNCLYAVFMPVPINQPVGLTLSSPVMPNGYTSKRLGPYWSNPPFLVF